MKTQLHIKVMAMGLIFFQFAGINLTAQDNWLKYPDNPVFSGAEWSSDAWSPVVIFEDNLFKMWFGGISANGEAIGYAESSDGINWEDANDEPVIPDGGPGNWDQWRSPGSVLRVNDTLKMWYNGSSDNFNYEISIGYAWSLDNIVWNVLPDKVLDHGEPGTWEETGVTQPVVYYDGSTYQMWYCGFEGTTIWGSMQEGYATSLDGISWVKDTINNPVITLGENGSFYDTWIIGSSVLYQENEYHMWFAGWDGFSTNPFKYFRIGHATSPDGVDWAVQNGDMPVLDVGQPGEWDDRIARYSSVLIHDGQFKMWYDGSGSSTKIGYATSGSPIIHVPGDRPTIQAGIDAASDGYIVLVDDGTYYENINFKGKAITLASQFLIDGDTSHISNTIIDGSQYTNADSASVVIFCSGEDTTSIINGFTITGGAGTYLDDWNDYDGGGIFITDAGAKIINNKIVDNIVDNPIGTCGGGICANAQAEQHWVVIENNYIADNLCLAVNNYAIAGGVYVGINGRIINNVIENNYCYCQNDIAQAGGFQGSCQDSYTHSIEFLNNTVINNNVEGNYSGGGYVSSAAGTYFNRVDAIIKDNIISGNKLNSTGIFGLGAGMYFNPPNNYYHILNNTISGNSSNSALHGGGIYFYNSGTKEILIDGNLIENNQADLGGGLYLRESYNVILTNNVFSGNYAESNGGAMIFTTSSKDDIQASPGRCKSAIIPVIHDEKDNQNPHIINNTFFNNTANNFGGALYSTINWNPVVLNSIFLENEANAGTDIYNTNSSEIPVYYSNLDTNLIHGNWEGENNIFVDPEFDADGYHLLASSQCIDAGTTSLEINGDTYLCPEFDIDGDMRPLNTTADIGADEVFVTGIPENNTTRNDLLLQNSPNPFNGSTSISFVLKSDCYTDLSIYDLTGKKIKTLINENLQIGEHEVLFDARGLGNGVYFCVLKTNKGTHSKKTIKLTDQ